MYDDPEDIEGSQNYNDKAPVQILLNTFYIGDPFLFLPDIGCSGNLNNDVDDPWLEFVSRYAFHPDKREPKVIHMDGGIDMVASRVSLPKGKNKVECGGKVLVLSTGFICVTENKPMHASAPVARFAGGLLTFDQDSIWRDGNLIFVL